MIITIIRPDGSSKNSPLYGDIPSKVNIITNKIVLLVMRTLTKVHLDIACYYNIMPSSVSSYTSVASANTAGLEIFVVENFRGFAI